MFVRNFIIVPDPDMSLQVKNLEKKELVLIQLFLLGSTLHVLKMEIIKQKWEGKLYKTK